MAIKDVRGGLAVTYQWWNLQHKKGGGVVGEEGEGAMNERVHEEEERVGEKGGLAKNGERKGVIVQDFPTMGGLCGA